ncbi:MAG TPA: hypothetical protein VFZ25_13990, partial [Chloroflexota bacterium]|nr:hypothetical protein [Chloroflexota bacterium]
SGIGCALASTERGARPVIVERASSPAGALRSCLTSIGRPEEREAVRQLEQAVEEGRIHARYDTTVIGLTAGDDSWRVRVQDHLGSHEVRAHRVVVATGGYVQPREHLPIAGPRGSGIITADFVHAALDAGLRPGRLAVIVGDGRYARGTAERLKAAGIDIARQVPGAPEQLPVDELRGDRRLEAVRVDGHWIDADTLVLAHRLLPSVFFLRDTGLIDGRPGVPVPVDAAGATRLAGVWAVGTCQAPDVDHRTSLEAGRQLGERLANRG